MLALKERIQREGKHLGRGVLKTDSFLGQQVDPQLMTAIGQVLAQRFVAAQPTRVLAAETSGIVPAYATATALGVPLVFARKQRAVGMPAQLLRESTLSQKEERIVPLLVSPEFLTSEDRVLIVDDFLTTAQTILALARLTRARGATVVGVGAVIEKVFERGREALSALQVPVETVVQIERFDNGNIIFKE